MNLRDSDYARQLQEEEDRATLGLPIKEFNCPLCFEPKNPKDGIILHCGHELCLICLEYYSKALIPKTELLYCATCNEMVTSRDIRIGIGDEWAEKYSRIETISVRKDTNLYHCPTPDCPNSILKNPEIDRFHCSCCTKSYCMKCNCELHDGLTCEQSIKANSTALKKEAEQNFKKLMKKGELKKCKCGNYIEKNGGCSYIKCPMCGLEFCWKCNQELPPNCKHTKGHGPNPFQFETNQVLPQTGDLQGKKDDCILC